MLLDEKHQKVAIEIIQKHRTKKHCNKCYDRGYIGFTQEKTIVPCEKCVDIEKAMEEWKQYVAGDSALKEDFKELFEEETATEETPEVEATTTQSTEHKEHKEEKHGVKDIVEKKVKVKKETTTTTTPKNKTTTQKAAVPRKSGRRSS